jgi:septal ring factor EnvC (AmiA/AmiB activator)
MEQSNGKKQQELMLRIDEERKEKSRKYAQELEAARVEEARLRNQYDSERDMARRAQVQRQLEQQRENRAAAEAAMEGFFQGLATAYQNYNSNSSSGAGRSSGGGCTEYVRGVCEAGR